jgi:hypothetical protein
MHLICGMRFDHDLEWNVHFGFGLELVLDLCKPILLLCSFTLLNCEFNSLLTLKWFSILDKAALVFKHSTSPRLLMFNLVFGEAYGSSSVFGLFFD